MKAPIIAVAFGIALAACAPLRQEPRSGEAGPSVASPNASADGNRKSEPRRSTVAIVDYAGRPCVNQILYVKMHPCIFARPQR